MYIGGMLEYVEAEIQNVTFVTQGLFSENLAYIKLGQTTVNITKYYCMKQFWKSLIWVNLIWPYISTSFYPKSKLKFDSKLVYDKTLYIKTKTFTQALKILNKLCF